MTRSKATAAARTKSMDKAIDLVRQLRELDQNCSSMNDYYHTIGNIRYTILRDEMSQRRDKIVSDLIKLVDNIKS